VSVIGWYWTLSRADPTAYSVFHRYMKVARWTSARRRRRHGRFWRSTLFQHTARGSSVSSRVPAGRTINASPPELFESRAESKKRVAHRLWLVTVPPAQARFLV